MRKHTLDNRKVTCPNARYLGVHNKLVAKRGNMLIYEQDNHQRTARVIGRIIPYICDGSIRIGFGRYSIRRQRFRLSSFPPNGRITPS
jgi:hypothetical protein